jgi:hypothetical protein
MGKRRRERFRNLGKLLGKLGGKVLRGFPISGRRRDFRTAVMARRTGRRDRGVRGIPGTVADRGTGGGTRGCWLECGRCRRD